VSSKKRKASMQSSQKSRCNMAKNQRSERVVMEMKKKIFTMLCCLGAAFMLCLVAKIDDGSFLGGISSANPLYGYVEAEKSFKSAMDTQDKAMKDTAKQVEKVVNGKIEEMKPQPPTAQELLAQAAAVEARQKAKEKRIFLEKAMEENEDTHLNELIYDKALAHSIDPYEGLYQVKKESTFRKIAYNSGCYGLTQISEFAVDDYQKHHPGFELDNMETLKQDEALNLEIGFFYLRLQRDMWQDNPHHGLMSYNGGAGYAQKMINSGYESSYYSRYVIGNAQKLKDKALSEEVQIKIDREFSDTAQKG